MTYEQTLDNKYYAIISTQKYGIFFIDISITKVRKLINKNNLVKSNEIMKIY